MKSNEDILKNQEINDTEQNDQYNDENGTNMENDEQKIDEQHDQENGQQQQRQNSLNKHFQSSVDKQAASGQANRIGAFKKQVEDDRNKSKERGSPYKGIRREFDANGGSDSKFSLAKVDNIEDGGSPQVNKHLRSQNQESDARQAVIALNEAAEVLNIISKFELNFYQTKTKINGLDMISLESDIIAQILNTCYQIVHDCIQPDNSIFDKENIESKIHQLHEKVKTSSLEYNQFKGEFFAVNEPVINKNIHTFKLDKVQGYALRQEEVIQKIPQHEVIINNQSEQLQNLKKTYQNFELGLFKGKLQDTNVVLKETEDLIQNIQNQQSKLKKITDQANQSLLNIIAQTKDQKIKKQKIQSDIYQVEKKLEYSQQELISETSKKQIYDDRHEECQEIVSASQKTNALIDMINTSRQLQKIVENYKTWYEMYKRLKELMEEQILTAEFELQKAIQESKRFQDQVQNEKKEEYDDVLRKIQKLAKKILDDVEEQNKRLENFDKKVLQPQAASQNITDQDMIFLKKEIVRNTSALQSAQAMTQEISDYSVKVRDESIQSQFGIRPNDLQELNANYIILQKQDEEQIPRIKYNIDQLEGYCIKSLKNQLNEDNKKSQVQISKMKKNYEDLQKLIDQLNQKIGKIAQQINVLKDQFQNDDLERENDIFNKLEDKLDLSEKDVNGERNESPGNMGPSEDQIQNQKLRSLQSRKKNIIAFINKMVNQFNDNNKLIKEANKNIKNEKEIGDLILKNKEIEQDCQKIEEKIVLAKDFSAEINGRLDSLLNPTIPEIKEHYIKKNQIIDDCDENFEKINSGMKKQQDQLTEKLNKLHKIMQKLNTVSPLNNPSNPEKQNELFMQQVIDKTDKAHEIRDNLEEQQDKLSQSKNNLLNLVQPLNELSERVVPKQEIENILKQLSELQENLKDLEKKLLPSYQELDKLSDEVDFMIENDKTNKLKNADNLLQNLENKIDELNVSRDGAYQKLNEYKNLIQEAKQSDNKDDPEFLNQLKGHENDSKQKEKELIELDAKLNDLKKKRNESKKLLEDINKNINKFSPQQIEGLIQAITEQIDKCGDLNSRYQEIEMELEESIRALKDLIDNTQLRKQLQKDAEESQKQVQDDLNALKNLLNQLPTQVELILQTLQEMKIGSEPDKNADYWEERNFIDKEIQAIIQIQENLSQYQQLFQKKNQEFEQLQICMKSKNDLNIFKTNLDDLKDLQNEVQDLLNSAYDARDEVEQIRKDMSDCQIPVNIQMRKNEIHGFQERLENIKNDFKEMKQADERFKGDINSENEIKNLIQQIDVSLREFESESRDIHKYQQFTLESYKEQDFLGYKNQKIIVEVRQFKDKIADVNERLKDLQNLLDDLNGKLMQQDMENASIILQKKLFSLRERLRAAEKTLKKIVNCGEQMDGNTSQQEEDEFIDALRDEMPEVFKNVNINFIHIDDTEKLLKQVLETKSIEKMIFLKKEIEEVTTKVEQSESLVIKLENEIIEWNALRKVCRRDEELQEIDSLAKEFKDEISQEENSMGKESQKIQQRIEKDGDQNDFQNIFQGLRSYISELGDLLTSVNNLIQDRDQCFQEFDVDVPKPVKEDRIKRLANDPSSAQGKKSTASLRSLKISTESNKPTDIYYLIEINCKYKQRIHEMLKDLRMINQKRKDLEEKYALLKSQLNYQPVQQQPPKKIVYKAVKGDEVDELFFYHLQKAGCELNVKRLAPGKYLFGTKNIMAKIINGKLVIRVGGGYMSADEFIEQYGKMEVMKMMRQDEINQGFDGNEAKSGNNGRQSTKLLGGASSMADAKAMLRQSLLGSIKTYDEGQSGAKVSKNAVNIKDIENKYEMAKIGEGSRIPAPGFSKIDGTPKRNQDFLSKTFSSNEKVINPGIQGSPKTKK